METRIITMSLGFVILAGVSSAISIVVRLFSPNFIVPWNNPIFTISIFGFYLFAVLAIGVLLVGISQTNKRKAEGY